MSVRQGFGHVGSLSVGMWTGDDVVWELMHYWYLARETVCEI